MRRLYGLDALRGIAAFMVFLHHLFETYRVSVIPFSSYLAVDLFFLLSGFVMARTYDERLGTSLTPNDFIALRYRRLWFPLAFGALVGFIVVQSSEGPSLGLFAALVAQLLFLPAPWHGWFALNLPAWSIFTEIICNGVHAVLRRTLLLVICCACSAIIFIVATILDPRSFWGHDLITVALSVPRSLCSYFIGVLLFRIWGDRPRGDHPSFAILLFPIALILGANLVSYAVFVPFAVLVLFPMILLSAAGLGNSRLAQVAGAFSFPLYAVHLPVIQFAKSVGFGMASAAAAALIVAVCMTMLFENKRRARPRPSTARQLARVTIPRKIRAHAE